jgi:PTS system, fructose-specific, IIB component/PTS system, fructose subfamily, IIC component
MAKIVAVTSCPTGIAHTFMAAEALQKGAEALGHSIKVETQGSVGAQNVLTPQEIAAADVVIIAADAKVETDRFSGKPIYEASTNDAIRHSQDIVNAALGKSANANANISTVPAQSAGKQEEQPAAAQNAYIVAITSCPTGIAHTFMAAEALEKAAVALGHTIKVETQGSVGAQNTLTPEEIQRANVVVIAADAKVDQSRFAGKTVYSTSTNAAMNKGQQVIQTALAQAANAPSGQAAAGQAAYLAQIQQAKKERSAASSGIYKHLMTGVSFMLPFVVAGGLLIALSFAVGGIYAAKQVGTLGWALNQIGGGTGAFSLIVPILAGYISYSIADRPGIAPGMIGGVIASSIGAGFLGGLVAGFLAGYLTYWLNKWIKLPSSLAGLKPILILPLLSTGIVGLLMIYVIGTPVSWLLAVLTTWLAGMQGVNALILGLILGGMMAIDMGGPINKSAYTFSVGLLASHVTAPMAAVMAAGMTPPLGLAIATMLFKNRFTKDEYEARQATFVLGLSFITEGAIPFAARDPFRVIPSTMLGSAVAGGLSMLFGSHLLVPHGGIFVLFIPGAVVNLLPYVVAILVGTVVTTGMLFILKRPIAKVETAPQETTVQQAVAA